MDSVAGESLTQDELAAAVETFSDKVNNAGLSIDTAGNIYSTNVDSHSISFVLPAGRKYSALATDERMLWPDGISYNHDGFMYVSTAQVHLDAGAPFNGGSD